jgi:hypothetical protein
MENRKWLVKTAHLAQPRKIFSMLVTIVVGLGGQITPQKQLKLKSRRKVNPASLTKKKSHKKKVQKNSNTNIIRICKPCGTDSKSWNGDGGWGTIILSGGGGPGTGKRR